MKEVTLDTYLQVACQNLIKYQLSPKQMLVLLALKKKTQLTQEQVEELIQTPIQGVVPRNQFNKLLIKDGNTFRLSYLGKNILQDYGHATLQSLQKQSR